MGTLRLMITALVLLAINRLREDFPLLVGLHNLTDWQYDDKPTEKIKVTTTSERGVVSVYIQDLLDGNYLIASVRAIDQDREQVYKFFYTEVQSDPGNLILAFVARVDHPDKDDDYWFRPDIQIIQ
ncbi:MAG: hypothetical protein WC107_02000 [Patescibacteria group bacterium]